MGAHACSVAHPDPDSNSNLLSHLHLQVGTHAYSVLDVRELGLIPGLNLGSGLLGKTKLIRLRNPWGKFEWKGAPRPRL